MGLRNPDPPTVNPKLCLKRWHDDDFGHQHQCSVLVRGHVCRRRL